MLERLLAARLVYSLAAMARALSFEYLNLQLVWHELSELLLFLLPLVDVGRLKAAVMARLPRLSTALVAPALAPGAPSQQLPPLPRVQLAGLTGMRARHVRPPRAAWDCLGHSTCRVMRPRISLLPAMCLWCHGPALTCMVPTRRARGAGANSVVEAAAAAAEGGQPCGICGARDVLVPYSARPCGHRFCYYCLAANTRADARFACPRCGARVEALQRWRPAAPVEQQ